MHAPGEPHKTRNAASFNTKSGVSRPPLKPTRVNLNNQMLETKRQYNFSKKKNSLSGQGGNSHHRSSSHNFPQSQTIQNYQMMP